MNFFSTNNEDKVTVVTHNGNFHPDDVFALATLCLYFTALAKSVGKAGKAGGVGDEYRPNTHFTLIRTRDEAMIAKADYVVDVGAEYDPKRRRFDHHQKGGAGTRANGIPYASFGLVWKEYGAFVCDGVREVADMVDKKLVQPTDAVDNGVSLFKPILEDVPPYTISDAIFSFMPAWNEAGNATDSSTSTSVSAMTMTALTDERFLQAMEFALTVLKREIIRSHSKHASNKIVEDIYLKAADKRIIIFDKKYPWRDVLIRHPEPLYVVMPEDMSGTWHVRAVSEDKTSFTNRKDFPASWAGKRDEELASVTGVKDAVFCHNGRFLAVAKSREGAIKLAKSALVG